jgi:hypothetical protein
MNPQDPQDPRSTPTGRYTARLNQSAESPQLSPRTESVSAPEGNSLALLAAVSGGVAPRLTPAERTGRPSSRLHRRQLADIRALLSTRDLAVLQSVAAFHFLTSSQLQLLHFIDHASAATAARVCRRTLLRLRDLRLLQPLDRRIGGLHAGSAGYVWQVGLAGDRLLRDGDENAARRRRKEPGLRSLDHCLAVADVHLTLVTLKQSGVIELLTSDTEPDCWRPYLGIGGARQTLKPDLFAATATADYEDRWFFEIDRATESLPTLLRKCSEYERYRRSGVEQRDHGVFPLVVWVLPNTARLERLQAGTRQTRGLDGDLFRLTTLTQLPTLISGAPS